VPHLSIAGEGACGPRLRKKNAFFHDRRKRTPDVGKRNTQNFKIEPPRPGGFFIWEEKTGPNRKPETRTEAEKESKRSGKSMKSRNKGSVKKRYQMEKKQ
jgi:hypothetical protein